LRSTVYDEYASHLLHAVADELHLGGSGCLAAGSARRVA
jgi:hypothetical protein